MRINNNIMALNAHRALAINQGAAAKAMEKLSSGLRINRAGDDAAGLAISEKMRGQIRGLRMAAKNAQDAISLIQTAEGALTESHAILQRMRELAVQAANDTNTDVDRLELQKEIDQLAAELTRIAETTEFNTKTLLDGSFSGVFHIGANEGQNISLAISDMSASALNVTGSGRTLYYVPVNNQAVSSLAVASGASVAPGDYTIEETLTYAASASGGAFQKVDFEVLDASGNTLATATFTASEIRGGTTSKTVGDFVITVDASITSTTGDGAASPTNDTFNVSPGGIDVSTQAAADSAITTINNAIQLVSAERSKLGALQNRLEHTIANLGVAAENLQAAESRIRDVDMAQEMMTFTRYQILQQASIAMLAQANVAPQAVLQLLG